MNDASDFEDQNDWEVPRDQPLDDASDGTNQSDERGASRPASHSASTGRSLRGVLEEVRWIANWLLGSMGVVWLGGALLVLGPLALYAATGDIARLAETPMALQLLYSGSSFVFLWILHGLTHPLRELEKGRAHQNFGVGDWLVALMNRRWRTAGGTIAFVALSAAATEMTSLALQLLGLTAYRTPAHILVTFGLFVVTAPFVYFWFATDRSTSTVWHDATESLSNEGLFVAGIIGPVHLGSVAILEAVLPMTGSSFSAAVVGSIASYVVQATCIWVATVGLFLHLERVSTS